MPEDGARPAQANGWRKPFTMPVLPWHTADEKRQASAIQACAETRWKLREKCLMKSVIHTMTRRSELNMIPRARANFFEGHAGAARSANVCTESCNHSLRRCKEIRMDAEDARAADVEFSQTACNKDDCDDIYSN